MTPTPVSNLASLAESFGRADTWTVLVVVLVFGALGGWAHRLGAPKEDKTRPVAYVILGSVSALAALFAIVPTEPLKLVGLSVVAGYAGKAVLSALQARVEAAVAKAETVKARDTARKAIGTGRSAIQQAEMAVQKAGLERHQLARHLAEKPERPAREIVLDLAGSTHAIRHSPFLAPGIGPERAEEMVRATAEPDLSALQELKGRLDGLEKSLGD